MAIDIAPRVRHPRFSRRAACRRDIAVLSASWHHRHRAWESPASAREAFHCCLDDGVLVRVIINLRPVTVTDAQIDETVSTIRAALRGRGMIEPGPPSKRLGLSKIRPRVI